MTDPLLVIDGWFGPLVRGVLLSAMAVLWTLLLVRMVGLRAFSKMTAFDFVVTIATGSLIAQAGTRARLDEYLQALAAIAGLLLVKWLLAKARLKSDTVQQMLSNRPVLLMENGRFLDAALLETRVSRANLLEKLRAEGVTDLQNVKAVVLETTGDISVICGVRVDEAVMAGVRRIAE